MKINKSYFNRTNMRIFSNLIVLLLAALPLTSCSETGYKFKLNTSKKVILGENALVTFEQIKGKKADSLHLYINNKRLKESPSAKINTTSFGVGKHLITALVFYPGKVEKLNNSFEVFAKTKPTVYKYKIVNTYPHDKKAYTQGLEFHDGFLYETTGRRGESWLRKVELETGKVVQQENLNKKYFGEGMTIFNNEIFWLTWQAKKGFTYALADFKQTGEFKYNESLQGWGLTHSDTELIKSDGSNKIWFLDPITKKEKRNIQVYSNDRSLNKLNELEYVNGKIFANYWMTGKVIKSTIAIINPENGSLEGLIGLNELRKEILKDQKLDNDDVLNGIAYDAKNNRIFVTGKHWGKLFEIELIKK